MRLPTRWLCLYLVWLENGDDQLSVSAAVDLPLGVIITDDLALRTLVSRVIRHVNSTILMTYDDVTLSISTRTVNESNTLTVLDAAKELLEFGILGLVSVTGCQAAEILMYPVAAWGLRHAIVTTNGCALSRERSPIAYVLRPDAELILDVFYDIMERVHARYDMVKEITLFYDDSLDDKAVQGFVQRLSRTDPENKRRTRVVSPYHVHVHRTSNHTLPWSPKGSFSLPRRDTPGRWRYFVVFCSQSTTERILSKFAEFGYTEEFDVWIVASGDHVFPYVDLQKWLHGNILLVRTHFPTLPARCAPITEDFLSNATFGTKVLYRYMVDGLMAVATSHRHSNLDTRAAWKEYDHIRGPDIFEDCGWNEVCFEVLAVGINSSNDEQIPSVNTESGISVQAHWTQKGRLKVRAPTLLIHPPDNFRGRRLRVGVPTDLVPHVFRVSPSSPTPPGDQQEVTGSDWPYQGFSIDLLRAIAERLNFTVQFIPSENAGGKRLKNGSWTGLVGMVVRQEVDVAVGPLMFSPKRQEDVRFSRPYMEDYNGILMSRSIDQPGQEARVFAPFASSVWLAIIGATISAGLLLHVTQVCHVWRTARRTTGTETRPIGLRLAERSPTQSDGPPFEDHDDKNFTDMAECSSSAQNSSHASNSALKHASDDDSQPIFHINSQSLTSSRCLRTCSGDDVTCSDQNRRRSGTKQNAVAYTEGKPPTEVPEEVGLRKPEVGSSIWAIYAMYLEQDSAWYPGTMSGRLLVVFWWLCTIVLSALYTAVLVATLSVSTEYHPLKSLDDLARPNFPLQPILLRDTNLEDLLENARNASTYSRIWSRLQASHITMPTNVSAALRLVRSGQYALVLDASILRHIVAKNCGAYIMAKKMFNPTNLGFVFHKESPLVTIFDLVILGLQQGGFVDKFRKQWWPTVLGDCIPPLPGSSIASADTLDLTKMAGAFLVILVAMVAGIVALGTELLCNKCLEGKQGKTLASRP